MKIVVADDHPVILDGIRNLIASNLPWEIYLCSDVYTARTAIADNVPDIVFSDVCMPGGCIVETIGRLRKQGLYFQTIFFSAHLTDATVRSSLALGVAGLLTKEDSRDEILTCLKVVASGGHYYSQRVKDRLMVSTVYDDQSRKPIVKSGYLSSREIEVLKCIGKGDSNSLIAEALRISIKTVNRHKSNIMDKLSIRNSSELMKYAIREGLSPI